ncbi:hypothetical protein [Microbacterium panaciterrae]|uniref:Lipoprotein n=1 Tax=Microbacterium panaciterrae TaxID=985759 RepID=A0ABP8PD82_9MICO
MTRRTATAIVIATFAVVGVFGLTACDPGTPKHTGSTSASPTATSTPTASATDRPMPPQAEAPKDEQSAISAAKKSYAAYLDVQLNFLKDLKLGPQYLSGYVLQGSPAWQSLNDTVDQQKESPVLSGGPIGWTTNDAMSYTAPTTNAADGTKLEFGSVHLFGCGDNTKLKFRNTSIPAGSFPGKVVLVYVPDAHSWMVQEDVTMRPGDGEAMPQC